MSPNVLHLSSKFLPFPAFRHSPQPPRQRPWFCPWSAWFCPGSPRFCPGSGVNFDPGHDGVQREKVRFYWLFCAFSPILSHVPEKVGVTFYIFRTLHAYFRQYAALVSYLGILFLVFLVYTLLLIFESPMGSTSKKGSFYWLFCVSRIAVPDKIGGRRSGTWDSLFEQKGAQLSEILARPIYDIYTLICRIKYA